MVNVYRRSLSSAPTNENRSSQVIETTQGLRRPRFSFFIFTCQNSPGSEDPSPLERETCNLISTANHNRYLSAVESLILMRSIKGRESFLGLRGQCSAAPQWPGYRPAQSTRQHSCVKKIVARVRRIFGRTISPYFLGTLRRTLSTILRRLHYNVCIDHPCSGGLSGVHLQGTQVRRKVPKK